MTFTLEVLLYSVGLASKDSVRFTGWESEFITPSAEVFFLTLQEISDDKLCLSEVLTKSFDYRNFLPSLALEGSPTHVQGGSNVTLFVKL
jgi:hypothetical protein